MTNLERAVNLDCAKCYANQNEKCKLRDTQEVKCFRLKSFIRGYKAALSLVAEVAKIWLSSHREELRSEEEVKLFKELFIETTK